MAASLFTVTAPKVIESTIATAAAKPHILNQYSLSFIFSPVANAPLLAVCKMGYDARDFFLKFRDLIVFPLSYFLQWAGQNYWLRVLRALPLGWRTKAISLSAIPID